MASRKFFRSRLASQTRIAIRVWSPFHWLKPPSTVEYRSIAYTRWLRRWRAKRHFFTSVCCLISLTFLKKAGRRIELIWIRFNRIQPSVQLLPEAQQEANLASPDHIGVKML